MARLAEESEKMSKDTFSFVYKNQYIEKWKSHIIKVLSAAIEAGFIPERLDVFIGKTMAEEPWKDIESLIKTIEKCRRPKIDMFVTVYGKLSDYIVEISFDFDTKMQTISCSVDSEDKKWLRVARDDKLKLNKLISAISKQAGIEVDVVDTSYDELALDEHGFVL